MDCGFATKCIYGDGKNYDKDSTGTISFPIYQTATYAHPAVGQSTGFDYIVQPHLLNEEFSNCLNA